MFYPVMFFLSLGCQRLKSGSAGGQKRSSRPSQTWLRHQCLCVKLPVTISYQFIYIQCCVLRLRSSSSFCVRVSWLATVTGSDSDPHGHEFRVLRLMQVPSGLLSGFFPPCLVTATPADPAETGVASLHKHLASDSFHRLLLSQESFHSVSPTVL